MKWMTAITTAPRDVNYLDATIRSIEAAGWDNYVVINDEKCKRGSWKNFRESLVGMLAASSYTDKNSILTACLIFQDDIEITAGLRSQLEMSPFIEQALRRGEILSLYTATPHHNDLHGWHAMRHDDLPRY